VDNIPPAYLSRTLAPWAMTVADVLDVRRLGYSYAAGVVRVPVAQFVAQALRPIGPPPVGPPPIVPPQN
jgi:hypothetical protein